MAMEIQVLFHIQTHDGCKPVNWIQALPSGLIVSLTARDAINNYIVINQILNIYI